MKRLFIFVLSFIFVFSLWQIGSGIFLTLFYTPNIQHAWENSANLSSEVILMGGGGSIVPSLLGALLAVALAYFIANKILMKKGDCAG